MRTIRIHAAASQEAIEAAAWYERERVGLGTEFLRAIDAALDILEDDVLTLVSVPAATRARGVKRLILRRFPFDVVVVQRLNEVFVLAFAHHARRPGYWR